MLAYSQYICGLGRLGHDVLYIETSGWPYACYDPSMENFSDDPTPGLIAVDKLLKKIGVAAKVTYVDDAGGGCYGMFWPELKETIAKADLLINVGGVCWLPEFASCGRRALIDMDPFFTQVGKFSGDTLNRYHTHFSYGTNIGATDCAVPTDGIEWKPLVPTVVPELWGSINGGIERSLIGRVRCRILRVLPLLPIGRHTAQWNATVSATARRTKVSPCCSICLAELM